MPGGIWGRDDELRRVHELIEAAGSGGAVLVLQGEAGIGKSRLASEAASTARDLGVDVVTARARESQRGRKLAMFDGVGPLTGVSSASDLVDAIGAWATRSRVAVVAEDLHWADEESLVALALLARSAADVECSVLLTTRPPGARSDLAALVAEVAALGDRGDVVHVFPLSDDAVAGLAADAIGRPVLEHERVRLATAGGNPLYALEIARTLPRAKPARPVTQTALLPTSLRELLLRRVNALPERTRDALVAASVLGAEFSAAQLAMVLATDGVSLYLLLRPALDDGLLNGAGDQLAFSHEVARVAVYEDVPLPLRRAMHRTVADRLRAAGVPAVEIAGHIADGAERDEPSSIEALGAAILEVQGRDWHLARRLLDRACELVSVREPRGTEYRIRLVGALTMIGRMGEARAVLDALEADDPTAPMNPHFHAMRATLLQRHGWVREAVDHRAASAQIAGRDDPSFPVLLGEAAIASLLAGDTDRAATQAAEAVDACGADDPRRAYGRMAQGWLAASRGDVDEALRLTLEAETAALPEATGTQIGSPLVALFRAVALADADRLPEATATLTRGMARAEQAGQHARLSLQRQFLALFHLFAGDVEEAGAAIEVAARAADEDGFQETGCVAFGIQAHVARHRGDHDALAEAVGAARAWVADRGPALGAAWAEAAAASVVDHDHNGQALEALLEAWNALPGLRLLLFSRDVAPTIARLAVDAGRRDVAAAVCADLPPAMRAPSAVAARLHCEALANGDRGGLERAVAAYRHADRPLLLAAALEDLARLFASTSATQELAAEAEALYAEAGAVGDAARCRAIGRARGSHRRQSRPRDRRNALTNAESAVADLAASGCTNKEIALQLGISRFTVETHMKRILAKLEVPNRTRLAVVWRDRR